MYIYKICVYLFIYIYKRIYIYMYMYSRYYSVSLPGSFSSYKFVFDPWGPPLGPPEGRRPTVHPGSEIVRKHRS